jgi:Mlc titration factor MtfA (ptsG expression regulator)
MFNFLSHKPAADPLNHPLWPRLGRALPVLQGLAIDEWERLEDRMRHFLRTKAIVGAHGIEVSDSDRLVIAAQACLPIMNLDDTAYRDWNEVIVYPNAFVSRDPWRDDAGLIHEEGRAMIGMARGDGPLLISLPDSIAGARIDGWNVVIHECAHKLDMLNGRPNGSPPLHAGMNQQVWSDTFSRGYRNFCRRLNSPYPSPIDPYAAENPAEFFAVLSESFFELPHMLSEEYPAIYEQLKLFYRQDPRERLPKPVPEHHQHGVQ